MSELLLRRRAAMVKSLPYDAEIEYLQGVGSQDIDTGLTAEDIDEIEIHCAIVSIPNNYYQIFGNYKSEETNSWRMLTVPSTQRLIAYANSTAALSTVRFDCNPIVFNMFRYSKTAAYLNGNPVSINQSTTIAYENTKHIALFSRGPGDYYGQDIIKPKIRLFRAWKGGNLMLDLMAVRIGQVGYMYDKVSRRLFGNAGTGNFVLGPDL